MWFLSFIPDNLLEIIVHAVLAAGIIGSIVGIISSKIPFISNYGIFIKIFGGILLIAGVFFEGSFQTEKIWRDQVAKLEEQIKISEEKAKEINETVVVEYKDRVKVVKDTQVVIQEKIKEVEKVVDSKCEVSPEAIKILNAAAKNTKPGDNK